MTSPSARRYVTPKVTPTLLHGYTLDAGLDHRVSGQGHVRPLAAMLCASLPNQLCSSAVELSVELRLAVLPAMPWYDSDVCEARKEACDVPCSVVAVLYLLQLLWRFTGHVDVIKIIPDSGHI